MTDVEPVVTDFVSTGRTGRRNAMPDILGSNAEAGAAGAPDLSEKLSQLSVADDGEGDGEGSSSSPPSSPAQEEEEKPEAT